MVTRPQIAPGTSGTQVRTFINAQVQALSDYVDSMVLGKVGDTVTHLGDDGLANGFQDRPDGRWVYMTLNDFDTLGSANSGGFFQGAWTQVLYEFFWNKFDNTLCPTFTNAGATRPRGVSATADFNANMRLRMPDVKGRIFVGAGDNRDPNIANKVKNQVGGVERVTLAETEMPPHVHTIVAHTGGGFVAYRGDGGGVNSTSPGGNSLAAIPTTDIAGGGQSHENMPPYIVQHVLIHSGYRVPT
jgi:hypothetical protein